MRCLIGLGSISGVIAEELTAFREVLGNIAEGLGSDCGAIRE
jgi:hypothetical protein